MQIVTVALHDLQLMIDRSAKRIIEAVTEKLQEPEEKDRWFDLTELCVYRPDKPAKATVYVEVQKRIIPWHKKGKKLMFLKSEIDAWLREGRKKTCAEVAHEADAYLEKKGGCHA